MFKFLVAMLSVGVFPMFLGLGGGQYLGQAKSAYGNAASAEGNFANNAGEEGAQLNPFFSQEMKATHSLTPEQQDELLTHAEAGSGGAFGGAEGQINRNAARTGNDTTVTKSLDEMARERAKVAAGASEGIASQDVMGAKELNKEGASGMQGLYGTNVQGQLNAMGQTQNAIKGEEDATGPNWLSQLDQIAKVGNDVAGAVTGTGKAVQGPGASSWLT